MAGGRSARSPDHDLSVLAAAPLGSAKSGMRGVASCGWSWRRAMVLLGTLVKATHERMVTVSESFSEIQSCVARVDMHEGEWGREGIREGKNRQWSE